MAGRLESVAEGVYRLVVRGAVGGVYFLPEPGVLVDAGHVVVAPRLLALAATIRPALPVQVVLVTHAHPDHAGGLAWLGAATGASLYMHSEDAALIRAQSKLPSGEPDGIVGRLMFAMLGRMLPDHVEAVEDISEVVDGRTVGETGIRAVHTPGHTAGHVSYLWEHGGGVLFVGDAASRLFGRIRLGIVNVDPDLARRSLGRLAGLDFTVACLGHGGVLRGRELVGFRRFLEREGR